MPDLDTQLDEQQVTIRHAIDALPETHDNVLRAMFAVRDLNRIVTDLRAARADNQRLREALGAETRCSTCSGDGRGRCICDKQVCTCYVSRDPSAPCHACKGSGLWPRSAEARAALAEEPRA